MAKGTASNNSDSSSQPSRLRDTALSIPEVLRQARCQRQLSQQQLAQKVGLRQRQISDLERAATDSRLSTVQNVARALDLELMLIPRHLIAIVEALQRGGGDISKRPLYALGDEPEEIGVDDHVEVGDTTDVHAASAKRGRAGKDAPKDQR
jgi:transcriptional regulator with XRE-family HTH domain